MKIKSKFKDKKRKSLMTCLEEELVHRFKFNRLLILGKLLKSKPLILKSKSLIIKSELLIQKISL